MNTPFVRVACLGLIWGSALLSGCGSAQTFAPAAAAITVESRNSEVLKVSGVHLDRQGSQTVLGAALSQDKITPSPTTGHLNIEIRKPDGGIVYQTRSETLSVPRHIIGKGSKFKRFHIPLQVSGDQLNPANTIVVTACTDPDCQAKPI